MYCPGALHDNLFGGAKPIIMPEGGSAETVQEPALVMAMTLDVAMDDFSDARRAALTLLLAAQYGVHPSFITLQASPGSLQLTITIATTNGTDAPIDVATLRDRVSAVDSSTLTDTIGRVMDANVTITILQPLEDTTMTVTREVSCQKGQWYVAEEDEPATSAILPTCLQSLEASFTGVAPGS
jgi:hypothetical protein